MDEQGYSATKYDDDHFVVHMNRINMAAFTALVGRLNPQSTGIFGKESFDELRGMLGEDANYARFRGLWEKVAGLCIAFKATEPYYLDVVGTWPLWQSIEDAVPEERHDEVKRELYKTLSSLFSGDELTKRTTRALAQAFTWASSPQGDLYWRTWNKRSIGEEIEPPPVIE